MNHLERIRALREDNDLTQAQIAALLHIGQRTYSGYELGKTRIPLKYMLILAEYYDVSMQYLCGLTDERTPFPKR